ncbi:hypothetical protein SPBR_08417 [Sporothrix brasiliensis 5110]|uniref:Uncharacterized protein n=1 Tax=Sporothrix brasiliensis 5110 TaxID=1398154 RepID=A0A0C2EKS6_9PEZI|nr:uncharacterized protein SPBR_08417 [Sporothrix brasiliensis 5110]KIH86654.1 hypothetical protein SPBR_08417 [Sporothrix brasiliensis 5110]
MVSALLAAAVLFGAAVEAIQYEAAPATFLPDIPGDAMSPKPTSPPELRRNNLFRRASSETTVYYAPDNTCGFLSGKKDDAYTCNDVSAQCAIITLSKSGYIGCCDDGDCGGFHLGCVDSSAFFSSSACGSSCQSDTFTLKCTSSDAPFCNSVSINGGASLKVYGYFCNDAAVSTMQPILTTYAGETDGRSFSASLLGASTTLDSTAGDTETFGAHPTSSSKSSNSASHPTTSGGGSSGGASSSPSPSPAPKKSTNTGAIAGGVVGGVAGLALIAAAIFFVLRTQRKNNGLQSGPAGPGAAAAGAPAPGVGPDGAPLAGAAVAGSPGMSQVNTPPPNQYYAADPTKGAEYAYAGQGSPQPGQPPYFQGQGQPFVPQQPYYAAAAVAPSPDRTDSTSPLAVGSSVQDYRMSSVSAAGSSPYTGAISPQTTGNTAVGGLAPGGQAQVPATIHEAGGNAVGGAQDFNANHHGEMHELA